MRLGWKMKVGDVLLLLYHGSKMLHIYHHTKTDSNHFASSYVNSCDAFMEWVKAI